MGGTAAAVVALLAAGGGAEDLAPDRGPGATSRARGDRITRRMPIASLDEIDDEVRARLRIGYDLDAA